MKSGLTFHWPDYRKVSFALPGFILLSVVMHGVAFTLFQVVYPASGMLRPPPVGVTLLTPSNEENRALLKWIAARDPALASKPQEVIPPGLLDLQYEPSFAELYTEPKPAELPAENIGVPSIMDSQALIATLAHNGKDGSPQGGAVAQSTQMRVSEGLSTRVAKGADGIGKQPKFSFQFKSTVSLEPAQFLVGVNPEGKVAYVFLQRSSGEPKMDREAESLVAKTHFEAGPDTNWGMICFCWGSDVFASEPRTEALP